MDRRQKLQKVFTDLDVNGDGRIDRSEFTKLLDTLGARLSTTEADAAFKDVDHDGNGTIDLEELTRWWKFPI